MGFHHYWLVTESIFVDFGVYGCNLTRWGHGIWWFLGAICLNIIALLFCPQKMCPEYPVNQHWVVTCAWWFVGCITSGVFDHTHSNVTWGMLKLRFINTKGLPLAIGIVCFVLGGGTPYNWFGVTRLGYIRWTRCIRIKLNTAHRF